MKADGKLEEDGNSVTEEEAERGGHEGGEHRQIP